MADGTLEVTYVNVDEVDPHPENANQGNVEAIKESIRVNGYYAPIIVQSSTGYILAGNHRYRAAVDLGMTQVPVIYLDVDDIEAKRIMVADNRTTRLGQDDDEALARLLEEIGESDQGLLGTGYSQADLQTLQDALETFDPAFESEPEPTLDTNPTEDWVLEPLEGPDGTCSSVLVHRFDRRALSVEDFQAIRLALGLGRAPRGALSTYGIGAWG